jgi:saccharopine dehydrogenase-like NADP-dependent oxidoreductase
MKILVIGAGRMGQAVTMLLTGKGHEVTNIDTMEEVKKTDFKSSRREQAVFACLPYHALFEAAHYARKIEAHYIDLTEDIGVRETVRGIASKCHQIFISGTGLAPGYINMIAGRIARNFQRVDEIQMFCGALPMYRFVEDDKSPLKYRVSWSQDGLEREYTAPAEVRIAGKDQMVDALEGYIIRNWTPWRDLEAFYTSGGAGTVMKTFREVKNISYRTLRYVGHVEELKRIGITNVAATCGTLKLDEEDIIYVRVIVDGDSGRVVQHVEEIYPTQGLTAIQYSTAQGAIVTFEEALRQKLEGFVRPECL